MNLTLINDVCFFFSHYMILLYVLNIYKKCELCRKIIKKFAIKFTVIINIAMNMESLYIFTF